MEPVEMRPWINGSERLWIGIEVSVWSYAYDGLRYGAETIVLRWIRPIQDEGQDYASEQ